MKIALASTDSSRRHDRPAGGTAGRRRHGPLPRLAGPAGAGLHAAVRVIFIYFKRKFCYAVRLALLHREQRQEFASGTSARDGEDRVSDRNAVPLRSQFGARADDVST